MDKIILSICIPLHNRCEKVIEQIERIIKIKDYRFDIIIFDSSEKDNQLMSIWSTDDPRVKIYNADSLTPAIVNWKYAMDNADGVFAFHLNDRDEILEDKLVCFIDFLEKHLDYNGGICKYIKTDTRPIICLEKEDALMNVPFFSSHPTGVVFNVKEYKKLQSLDSYFSTGYGIHPHDIVLALLSQQGKLFIYTDEIWRYASHDFYKNSKSGVNINNKRLFFEPQERIFELKNNISVLNSMNYSKEIKEKKKRQMYKTYLGLSTNTYFYMVESAHETAHYGIPKEEFSITRRIRFSKKVFEDFKREFDFSDSETKEYKRWLIKTISIPIISRVTSKIKNDKIRNILRKMRLKREVNDQALLR